MSLSRFFDKNEYLASLTSNKSKQESKHESKNETNDIENLKIKKYMLFNNDSLNAIVCKSNVPLIYIHTKYCYSMESRAKVWKIDCSKCKKKIRNNNLWHCRCECGKCKSHFNFCTNCYNEALEQQKQMQKIIINTWKRKHVKQWVNNTKWLNISKKDMKSFKGVIIKKILNNINGKQLLNLTELDIINLSHKLPYHWQYGFESTFCGTGLDKMCRHYQLQAIDNKQSRVQRCNEISRENDKKIIILTTGYIHQIIENRSRNIGIDVIFLISKFINLGLILNTFDLKILNKEKVYIFDEIVMEKGSKLIIGPKVKGIHVLNDIIMNNKSIITSNIHYEQPANINIKCDGNMIMNGGLIDIQVANTYNKYETNYDKRAAKYLSRSINIVCNSLKMNEKCSMRTVLYVSLRIPHDDGMGYEYRKEFGCINIKMKATKDIEQWYDKVRNQFEPPPNVNGQQSEPIPNAKVRVCNDYGYWQKLIQASR